MIKTYIRGDLEEAIKKQFGVEKFSYRGIGKNDVCNSNLLIFNTNQGTIAIEIGPCETYDVYKVKATPEHPDRFRRFNSEINCMYTFGGNTYWVMNNATIKFPGKAFDFTEALVLFALEDE